MTEAAVIQCETKEQLFAQLQGDIDKQYEQKPVIVILEDHQRSTITQMAKDNKWRLLDS